MANTKDQVLDIFSENAGIPVSGQDIADRLGITRAAVWKVIAALKEDGYVITASGNRGYIFSKQNDVMTTASVVRDLKDAVENLNLLVSVIDETESTNNDMKEAAKAGAPEGTCLIAKKQTAGKGRLGRSFFSPRTGIYFSFILRPHLAMKDSMLLTTIAAVAVRDAIEEVTGFETGIKWVNDVYINGKKVCGILTEAEADVESQTLSYAVVGIGINITDPEGGWPDEIKNSAASIYGNGQAPAGVMSALAAAVIRNYFAYYSKLPEHVFMKSYKEHQILTGKKISVIRPDSSISATALGVDDEGRLLVKYDDGREEAIFTGEVSVRLAGNENVNRPEFR